MAQVKPQHYWRQLREVLTAGKWDARMPAKDYSGRPVSWSDLLRKFHKHCPGHPDVAELASQTQALSLLLSANEDGLDGNACDAEGVLVLGEECMLAEERIQEGLAGYNTLKQLDASRSDVRLAKYLPRPSNLTRPFPPQVNKGRARVLRICASSSIRMSRPPRTSQGPRRRARSRPSQWNGAVGPCDATCPRIQF